MWPVVRPLCPACSISRCAQHSFQSSLRSQRVCVCVLIGVCTYSILCIYRCLYACACTLLPSSVVFSLFPFPATAWSNECLGLILLSPSSSSFTRLFPPFFLVLLLCCIFSVCSLFCYYIWFIFILPPSSPPLPPPPLFCDTASWDRSGRQPRSHTGQSTSHLNQSINQSVNHFLNPSSQSHNASLQTLPFPTHPTDLPHCSCPVLLLSSSLSFAFSPFSLWTV